MTKRTRLFLAIAVGVLVVGLGTGLVASYMGGFQGLAVVGGDGPEELVYVPADARFLAYVDVRDVMSSEVRQKLSLLQPGTNTGAEQFKEETGIDLETDIDYLVAAAAGDASTDSGQGDPPLMLAKGRFDNVRIEGLIRNRGGVVEQYQEVRLVVHETMKFAVAFLEPGLVAVGPPAAVKAAIDTKVSGADVKGNDELMRLVRENDDGDAWVVARFDSLAGARLPAEVASQLPPINWFSARAYVDTGLQGQVSVETRDEASAQNLQEVIRGFVALGRLQTGQHPELAEVLNSFQLSGTGNTVSLSFTVPSEMIDALGALRAGRRTRPAPAPTQQKRPVPPAL